MHRYKEYKNEYTLSNDKKIIISTLCLRSINDFGYCHRENVCDIWISGDIDVDLADRMARLLYQGKYDEIEKILQHIEESSLIKEELK